MSKDIFDKHAQNYRDTLKTSLGCFGKSDTFFDTHKINYIKDWVVSSSQPYDILDFGCGIGKLTCLLAKDFQQSTVYGYDTSKESLSIAREENAGLRNIYFINELSGEQKYDLVIAANVFHHIKPAERIGELTKMKGLLKPAGKIIIFEHNPFNPVTRYIVSRCPFDSDAELIWCHKFIKLAAACGLKVEFKRYILFFPWYSRLLKNIEYQLLMHFPLGAQYMLLLTVC